MSLIHVTYTAILYITMLSLVAAKEPHPLSDEFIDQINAKQNLWKAGRNFHEHTPIADIIRLMGVLPGDEEKISALPVKVHDESVIASLPENFDPREKWPNCPTLNDIRDQGSCGSCWAFGAVEAMTDRYCIYSNGSKQFYFSAEDLLTCCDYCALECTGGYTAEAWKYWKEVGVVSGGGYNSSSGCRPYEVPPCKHMPYGNGPLCNESYDIPECSKSCQSNYDVSYEKDKKFAKAIFSLDDEDHIKAELFQHGPVEVSFVVYSDFAAYKSGVYRHDRGIQIGKHAVKLMGWGVEKGVKYWLVANSWNTDFGEKGFFKIIRGENHCGIEDTVIAGEPLIV